MASHGSARGRAHAGRRWQSGHQANPAICCQMIFLTNDVGRRTPAQAVALMDHDGLGGRSEMKVPVPAGTGSRPARRTRSVLAAQRQARYPPPPKCDDRGRKGHFRACSRHVWTGVAHGDGPVGRKGIGRLADSACVAARLDMGKAWALRRSLRASYAAVMATERSAACTVVVCGRAAAGGPDSATRHPRAGRQPADGITPRTQG